MAWSASPFDPKYSPCNPTCYLSAICDAVRSQLLQVKQLLQLIK
jgi:hypothetical protein